MTSRVNRPAALGAALSLGAFAAIGLGGCGRGVGAPVAGDAAPPSSASAAPVASAAAETAGGATAATTARVDALRIAEQRRSAGEVTLEDQQSRDVEVRRAAARALARIGGEAARAGLRRALGDEDGAVVGLAAYGLGASCKGHEKEDVAALAARSLSLDAGSSPPPVGAIDPVIAVARAIGRCAAPESEPTLVAWLGASRRLATAAALGLGDMAATGKRLREETFAALMNLAAGSAAAEPLPEAMFAASRADHVPPSIVPRVREVAVARLAHKGEARVLAVRALGRAGGEAAPELAKVLGDTAGFTAAERAEAARALGRLGADGQDALAEAIPSLAPSSDPVALTGLVGDGLGPLLVALDSLKAPGKARKALRELAALPVPPGAPAPVARRIAWIRCSAAKVVVGSEHADALLAKCDPTAEAAPEGADAGAKAQGPRPGSIGARAVVAVLDRAEIRGPRQRAWLALAKGDDVRAREAAIELLEAHAEIDGAADVLADALASGIPGVVSTAADVIAKQPQRASDDPATKKAKKPRKRKAKDAPAEALPGASPAVVKALLAALASAQAEDDPEVTTSVTDAVAALALAEAQPRLEELCKSTWPALRDHAQKALAFLTGQKPVCEAPVAGGEAPPELAALARGPQKLTFDTDVGALSVTLDADVAPVAVTRLVELAKAGFYDGRIVHRVVPGFVAQLGAPLGDGYGGPPGKRPLRCETTPLPFGALTVGVALAGRDTGSSQIFVTHAMAPHLDGQYAWLGTAEGPWGALVDGDVVRKVTVASAPK
jgi:cyclophilin family peptidyl-prolyl cis-trans isomerase/HEAT repeat protein